MNITIRDIALVACLALLSTRVAAQSPSENAAIDAIKRLLTANPSNNEFWCSGLGKLARPVCKFFA